MSPSLQLETEPRPGPDGWLTTDRTATTSTSRRCSRRRPATVGLHLENDLCRSEYWSRVPLERKAAILLFLVDKGVVARSVRHGRRVFEPLAHAESWVGEPASPASTFPAVIELFAALRHELSRRVAFEEVLRTDAVRLTRLRGFRPISDLATELATSPARQRPARRQDVLAARVAADDRLTDDAGSARRGRPSAHPDAEG